MLHFHYMAYLEILGHASIPGRGIIKITILVDPPLVIFTILLFV